MFCTVFLFCLTSASTTSTFFIKHFFKESKVCKKYPTVKHLGSCNFFDVWPSEDRKAIGDQRSKLIVHKSCCELSLGPLICTLVSENQGLQKSRSDSNFRSYKSGFFSSSPPEKNQVCTINLKKIQVTTEKKSRKTLISQIKRKPIIAIHNQICTQHTHLG